MSEPIRLVCPQCDTVHRVKAITLGKIYRCKKCRTGLVTLSPAILACPECGAARPPAYVEVSRLITCTECANAPLMRVSFPGDKQGFEVPETETQAEPTAVATETETVTTPIQVAAITETADRQSAKADIAPQPAAPTLPPPAIDEAKLALLVEEATSRALETLRLETAAQFAELKERLQTPPPHAPLPPLKTEAMEARIIIALSGEIENSLSGVKDDLRKTREIFSDKLISQTREAVTEDLHGALSSLAARPTDGAALPAVVAEIEMLLEKNSSTLMRELNPVSDERARKNREELEKIVAKYVSALASSIEEKSARDKVETRDALFSSFAGELLDIREGLSASGEALKELRERLRQEVATLAQSVKADEKSLCESVAHELDKTFAMRLGEFSRASGERDATVTQKLTETVGEMVELALVRHLRPLCERQDGGTKLAGEIKSAADAALRATAEENARREERIREAVAEDLRAALSEKAGETERRLGQALERLQETLEEKLPETLRAQAAEAAKSLRKEIAALATQLETLGKEQELSGARLETVRSLAVSLENALPEKLAQVERAGEEDRARLRAAFAAELREALLAQEEKLEDWAEEREKQISAAVEKEVNRAFSEIPEGATLEEAQIERIVADNLDRALSDHLGRLAAEDGERDSRLLDEVKSSLDTALRQEVNAIKEAVAENRDCLLKDIQAPLGAELDARLDALVEKVARKQAAAAADLGAGLERNLGASVKTQVAEEIAARFAAFTSGVETQIVEKVAAGVEARIPEALEKLDSGAVAEAVGKSTADSQQRLLESTLRSRRESRKLQWIVMTGLVLMALPLGLIASNLRSAHPSAEPASLPPGLVEDMRAVGTAAKDLRSASAQREKYESTLKEVSLGITNLDGALKRQLQERAETERQLSGEREKRADLEQQLAKLKVLKDTLEEGLKKHKEEIASQQESLKKYAEAANVYYNSFLKLQNHLIKLGYDPDKILKGGEAPKPELKPAP